ncbi:MAG: TIGR02281 family clan AA aspartic protease [Rhodomicrobium sp.]|jgi:aspartyl protease family protein
MESRKLQRRILKELLVWAVAIGGAYLTFSSFEPLFDRAKQAASLAGFAHLFEFETNSPKLARFNTKVLTASAAPLRGTISASQEPTGARKVVLSANDYGHFHAVAQIKGQQVEFMTDTGATYVALSYETAQKLGLAPQNLRFNGRSTTANGVARVASIVLDTVRIGDITVKDVQAVIAEPGRMTQNLLGMSFIRQLSGFELSGARLTMIE